MPFGGGWLVHHLAIGGPIIGPTFANSKKIVGDSDQHWGFRQHLQMQRLKLMNQQFCTSSDFDVRIGA